MLVALEFLLFVQLPEANDGDLVCADRIVNVLDGSGIEFWLNILKVAIVLAQIELYRGKRFYWRFYGIRQVLELVLLVQRLVFEVFIFHAINFLPISNFLKCVICDLHGDELFLFDRIGYALMVLRVLKLEASSVFIFILF